MVTIGKYLYPGLYISYGHSLFAGSNVAKLRYEIDEHWEIESEMGDESGADLFYKIEFK
jgi:translocation and assembly module TamB